MSEHSKLKYRYFFLSFAIAFFVLSLTFFSMMSAMQPQMPESLLREPEETGVPSVYMPSAQDSLSVLFIGVENENAKSGTFLLARFDPAGGRVPIIVFPAQTLIKNNDKSEPIAEVYSYGGAEYTKNALAETLGVPIDRYVKMRTDTFIAAAAAIGTIEYDLQDSVTIRRGGAEVTLKQGLQLLDGQKVADIIGHKYPQGKMHRCKVTAEIAAAIVNQRKDIFLSAVMDNIFEKVVNIINTDISYPDYYERKDAAMFLAKMHPHPAQIIEVAGAWNQDSSEFVLADTFLAGLRQVLG